MGYDEFPLCHLAVQDATLSGELSYSAKYPNEAWVENWTNSASSISWQVDVKKEAYYQIEVYYTAKTKGSSFVIECDGARLESQIKEAYQGELISSPDRVPRAESYEKKFKKLVIGEIYLSRGHREIKLTCTNLKGESLIDVKALNLKLLN